MTVYSFLILFGIVVITVIGDYCIKIASGRDIGLASLQFLVGALMYGLPAVGWLYLMRVHSLAAIGVFYSATTLLLLAGLGYFVFKENFGLRKGVGLTLAIMSLVVMSYES